MFFLEKVQIWEKIKISNADFQSFLPLENFTELSSRFIFLSAKYISEADQHVSQLICMQKYTCIVTYADRDRLKCVKIRQNYVNVNVKDIDVKA